MSTTFYIVRHGQAVVYAAEDSARALSPFGEVQARTAAKILEGIAPDEIIASPYLRAQQTAQIIRESAGFSTSIKTEPGITPDDDPKRVASKLEGYSGKTLLMVSHNPLVSMLVSWLVDGQIHGSYAMGTASIACIEFDEVGVGLGDLRWLKHVDG